MCGDSLGSPHELIIDLLGGHKPHHFEAQFVAGSPIREQVKRYLVVSLSEYLLLFPGATIHVAGNHITDGLEITVVQVKKVHRGWTAPIFLMKKINVARPGKHPSHPCPEASIATIISMSCARKEMLFLRETAAFHQWRSDFQASSMRTRQLMDAVRHLVASTLFESRNPERMQLAEKSRCPTRDATW